MSDVLSYEAIIMKHGPRRMIFSAAMLAAAGVLSASLAIGQVRPEPKPAEQLFKNVQSLKGIPANQFMATMGFFSASLGQSCTFCHIEESGGSWERYADDNDHKRTARRMIAMVSTINKNYFMGRRVLTCYTCHRGSSQPEITPDLAQFYAPVHVREPDQMVNPFPNAPAPDQVLDKYIQALGGAQRLAGLTSFTAKGTSQGYATSRKRALELYAKAPGQRTEIVHGDGEDTVTMCDGREAWTVAPLTDKPLPVIELLGGDLDGAKLDAMLSFPADIKRMLSQWRVGPPSTIEDRDVTLVQGTIDGRYPVNLYFDDETGLLARMVRYSDSLVGLAPTQVDYSDYREVAGVKMPFKWTVTWLDGRSAIQLSEVQPNAAIDPSKFARPAPPGAAGKPAGR
jgi:outer membrane lipoprotein-sorting protein